jgi:hypothetical protein
VRTKEARIAKLRESLGLPEASYADEQVEAIRTRKLRRKETVRRALLGAPSAYRKRHVLRHF